MKKLLGIVLAIAVLMTLVTIIPSFAASEIMNLDFVNAVDDGGNVIEKISGAQGVNDFGPYPIGATLGNLKGQVAAGATKIQVVGWYLPPKEMTDIGVRIDGAEEIIYDGYASSQQALNEAIVAYGMATAEQAQYTLRIDAYIPIQAGHHTLVFMAKFADGSDKEILVFSYSNDDLVSVGKPVHASLSTVPAGGGALISDNAFWNVNFVVDGSAYVFDGATTVPLGIYLSTTTEDVDAKIYIDLQGVYKLNEVVLRPMGFNNIAFPQQYKVLVSETGDTWTEIGSESGVYLNTWAHLAMFATDKQARYILVQIEKFNLLNDGGGIYYAGLGEIEAYGTKVADASEGKAPYEPYKNYTGAAATGDAGGYSAWTGFTTGDLDFNFSFRTDCSFYAIGFPAFWGYPGAPLTFEFSKNGSPVHSVDYTCPGDGPFVLDLGTTLEKGEYDVTVTINDDTPRTDPDGYLNYFVMGYASEGNLFDDDYFVFERGNVALDLYSTENTKNGFVPIDYVEPYTPVVRDFDAAQGDALSYDQILVNGSEIANGNSAVIAAKKGIDGTDGSIETVTLHGWYGNASQAIDQFGYQINGGRVVYGDFKSATEDAVYGAGGQYASRFTVPVDVSALKNDGNVIWIWAKLANGDEVQLNRFDNRGSDNEKDREVYVIFNAPASQGQGGQDPVPTADASMVLFVVAAAAIALVLLKKKAF